MAETVLQRVSNSVGGSTFGWVISFIVSGPVHPQRRPTGRIGELGRAVLFKVTVDSS